MADSYAKIGLSLPKIRSVLNLIYLGLLKYYLHSRDFDHEAPKNIIGYQLNFCHCYQKGFEKFCSWAITIVLNSQNPVNKIDSWQFSGAKNLESNSVWLYWCDFTGF